MPNASKQTANPKGSKTTQTPGPWLVRALFNGLSVIHETGDGNYVVVAQVHETQTKVGEPDHAPFDAELISQAPELYKIAALVESIRSDYTSKQMSRDLTERDRVSRSHFYANEMEKAAEELDVLLDSIFWPSAKGGAK